MLDEKELKVFLSAIENQCKSHGDPDRSERARRDKNSGLLFFAIRVPVLRKLTSSAVNLQNYSDSQVFEIWDYVFKYSLYYEPKAIALNYYSQNPDVFVHEIFTRSLMSWSEYIENWGHCDALGNVISQINRHRWDHTKSSLNAWCCSSSRWKIRLSIVSLVNYVGKNSTFLPFSEVEPFLTPHLKSNDIYINRAVGWVLREYLKANDTMCYQYIEHHKQALHSGVRSKLKHYLT